MDVVTSFSFLPSALGLISTGDQHPQSPAEVKSSCMSFLPLRIWPSGTQLPALGRKGTKFFKSLSFQLHPWANQLYRWQEELWMFGKNLR